MKKYILLLLTIISFAAVRAQQIPLYSTYYFNKFMNNPAFAGFDNEYRFFGFYRAQWTGIPGAPVTRGGSFEGSFWKDRIGAGLSVVNDNTDIIKRVNVQATYAQKIRFAKDHQISLGISGGIFDVRVDYDKAKVTDLVDQTVLFNSQSKVMFDMSVGLTYSWKKLAVGFAIPQILNTSARYTSNLAESKLQLRRHYVATAQYEINLLKEQFNITPIVMLRKGTVGPVQADMMCVFDYKHIGYVGAGYRTAYGVSVMGGVKIAKLFTVAYAYDINTSKKIKSYVGGTHEVIVGFSFSNPKKDDLENAKKIAKLAEENAALKKQTDSIQQQVDSTKQQIDSLNALSHLDRKPEIDALNKRVDSLEDRVRELERMKNDFKERKVNKNGTMVGNIYELDQIYFDYKKWNLLPMSTEQLNKLVNVLKRKPSMEVEIQGNTDSIASNEYNKILSSKRADEVVKYLVSRGISASRLKAVGLGEDNPVEDNGTDEGRQKNRRVEFVIMKE